MKLPSFLKKDAGLTALLIAGVFAISIFAGYLTPLQIMELKIRDMLFEIRGAQTVEQSDIIIVEISQEADYEIPYKYPWPTYVYAKLIENLNRAGVKAIGLDLIFDQRDIYDLKNDSLFADALSEYGNVILAANLSRQTRTTREGIQSEHYRLVAPNNVLREANPNPVGLVNTLNDQDEFIRNYVLNLEMMDQSYYSFGLEVLRLILEDEPDIEYEDNHLKFGPYRIPTIRGNTMFINYYGSGRTFEYLGFEEIIDDRDFDTVTEMEAFEMNLFDDPEYGILHQGILEDKIVLVGATMPELQDLHPVPMKNEYGGTQMAGVEIHAHALQTIIDENFMYRASREMNVLFVLFFSFLIVLVTRRFPFWGAIATTFLVLIAWLGISIYLFIAEQLFLFYLSPTFAIIGGLGAVMTVQYFKEEREKGRIIDMFSSYVSPELVNRLVESRDVFRLGGEEVEITAFFSDVVNFSTLSEQLTPRQLIELMNEYLDEMTEIVLDEEGTLDKYIGDAVMAFYGAPADVEDHAVRACRSAVRMQQALKGLRKRWTSKNRDLPEDLLNLRVRIGINTGKMIVGNMGSKQRFNYTILGDQVNIAARCEVACKKYGVETVVTASTREQAIQQNGDQFLFRSLDHIRVKGRVKPIRIYELVGFKTEQPEIVLKTIKQFEEGLELFYKQQWEEARKIFIRTAEYEELLTDLNTRELTPSSLYIERCDRFQSQPPDKTWDGVFEQTEKI